MDARPIGVFDSGVGGLTVLKQIHRLLPRESTIYLGDTARIPYGNRSNDTIIHYSDQIVRFLITCKVKAIVIACSTASAIALPYLKKHYHLPLIGVIKPTAKMTLKKTRNHQVIVLGTLATIRSGVYQRLLSTPHSHLQLTAIACPLLVPIIEENITSGPILTHTLDLYLKAVRTKAADTLVLGCTHYPLIAPAIQRYFPRPLTLINPGQATALHLKDFLNKHRLLATATPPKYIYYTTDQPPHFLTIAVNFLGHPIKDQTRRIILKETSA